MGCDIHGHIEYKRWSKSDNPYDEFSGGLGTRDYLMFGLLAGVRCDGCIFPPRGIPQDVSGGTKFDYYLFVSESEDADNQERTISRKTAQEYTEKGWSEWFDEEHKFVTHPDWHTPSWLTTSEFEQVLNERKKADYQPDPEWDAILAAMKALPDARFVFWFDN